MPRCMVTGSYNGHLAVACIDSTVPVSSLSSRFADDHSDMSLTIKSRSGIVLECTCSAPMRLPSIGGVYVSRMPISVGTPTKTFDLVIGADWIAATRATVTDDGLAEPSKRILRHLSSGHTWEPFPKQRSPAPSRIGQLQKIIMRPQAMLRPQSILGLKSPMRPKKAPGIVYGPFQLPRSIKPRAVPPRKNEKELGRGRVEIPFDITHYIVSLLDPTPEPNSFVVDVVTMKQLCLVSRAFNAAANAVLYSSITVSETIAPSLIATARVNPSLFYHCHSLWFKAPTKGLTTIMTWFTVAQIVSACPNLRRIAWLRDRSVSSMNMSMWSEHLPQVTDLTFLSLPLILRSIGPTHCFPRLERLAVGEARLQDEAVVDVLLRMPQLTDLVTDPPSALLTIDETRVETLAQGIATVVAGTALRRIIWARLYSVVDQEKPSLRSEFERYIPICARAHELLYAPDGRHGVTFEFVSWSPKRVQSHILDGTIWKRDEEDRPRICP